jgi:hypothetical protein
MMTTDTDDYKPELETADHEVIEVLTQLKAKGNASALIILRERFTPADLEANEAWQKANSTAKRRREEHERDETDRRRHEDSLCGASRIAAILRRSAGV